MTALETGPIQAWRYDRCKLMTDCSDGVVKRIWIVSENCSGDRFMNVS